MKLSKSLGWSEIWTAHISLCSKQECHWTCILPVRQSRDKSMKFHVLDFTCFWIPYQRINQKVKWFRGGLGVRGSLTVSFNFPLYETDPFPRSPALSWDMSSPVWLELQRSTLRTLCLTQVVAPLQSTMPTPTGLNLGQRCQWTKSCNRKNMSMMCLFIFCNVDVKGVMSLTWA